MFLFSIQIMELLINMILINRYGLANYYMTCDKKLKAERHYQMAMEINPNHAVLMCCLGKVSENFFLSYRPIC